MEKGGRGWNEIEARRTWIISPLKKGKCLTVFCSNTLQLHLTWAAGFWPHTAETGSISKLAAEMSL